MNRGEGTGADHGFFQEGGSLQIVRRSLANVESDEVEIMPLADSFDAAPLRPADVWAMVRRHPAVAVGVALVVREVPAQPRGPRS